MILLQRPDLYLRKGSVYCISSVVIAPSSPVQPLSPFQAPVFLHLWAQQSHTSSSLLSDHKGENNVEAAIHIPESLRTQSVTGSPAICVKADHRPACLCSWAVTTCGVSLSAGRAVSSEGYLCLDLYKAAFVSAAFVSQWWNGGKNEASSYFINMEKLSALFRNSQVCETDKSWLA